MAPEQARGEKVDGSADIYSLGKMIGEVWGSGDRSNTMPKPLAEVVGQMLETDPKKRPALDIVKAALDDCCRTLKA
jgi:serine/threonine protein kinase